MSPAASVVPPKLKAFVAAELPPELGLTSDVTVGLVLVVDEQGRVQDADVAESQGEALDQLALAAAQKFEFEPARQGDATVSVRIRYAYVFEAPKPLPPVAAAPVVATPAAQTPPPAPSAAPPPSPAPPSTIEEFEATASVEAQAREVTRRSVDQETIRRLPGTRGDALRSIEVLPGVARTSPGDGTPILRGAAWNESQTYLNGTPVPFLYHFGGLTSFLSPRLVERVDLYPGNFSARYGRVSGGVIDIQARDPESKRLRAALDFNLIDSSAYVEAPLGERAGFAAAVRRSNIDFFFENFVPEDAYSVVAAPLYYDYQALGVYRFDSATRLRVLGYGSRDTMQLFFADPPDEDPVIAGNVAAVVSFHRLGLELERVPGRGVGGNVSVTVGRVGQELNIGELEQKYSGTELLSRAELSAELLPELRLNVGGDLFAWFVAGTYHGPAPGQTEGDPSQNDPLSTRRLVSAEDNSINIVRPGAYAELVVRPVPALALVPGIRVDYFGDVKHTAVDPRFSARLEVSPETTLKLGVGSFSQGPEWWQALPSVGNTRIAPYRALQSSAGVEQRFGEHIKLSVEGFYKHLYGTIVETEDGAAPYLENDGAGRIYGGELGAHARWAPGGMAYLAYTLQRSERSEHDAPFRLFDRDQTHILSLVGSQDLGKGWEVGARLRLVSGNPTTPIVGSVYDARSGAYVPEYGGVNSVRDPMFQQLDLRVEKTFVAGPVKLAAYLDVQNVYNAKNYEGKRYSFDYSTHEAVTGLPILPNLGLRGEL